MLRTVVRAKEINFLKKEKEGRGGKKEDRGRERGKMTRYGVCLILERGEVSLPEGLQRGDVSLLVRVGVLLHKLLCF